MSATRPDKVIPRSAATLFAAVCAAACVATLAPAASAQSGWNRAVDAIAVTPDPALPAQWDISAVTHIHLSDTFSFPLDLSMVVELSINGTVVASNTHTIGGDPGGSSCPDGSSCGGSCGSGTVDGNPQTLLCVPDGACNPLCDCTCAFPPITSVFPGVPLQPGDEIMVILYPAPGALPDSDTSDNQLLTSFEQEPIQWDRQITAVELQPSAAGPDLWDVSAEGVVLYSGMTDFVDPSTGSVPLSFELDLLVNGILVSTSHVPFDPLPLAAFCGCGSVCGSYEGFDHACLFGNGSSCGCGWPWLSVVPSVPLVPGDEIMVLLRPAPGALPELPGFEEDDERRVLCCGATGVGENISIAAGVRLEQNRPNPFDRSTTIAFATRSGSRVTLEVFDVLGRRVRTLVDGTVAASTADRSVTWSGRTETGARAPAGIYFYRLTAEGHTQTRKMTLAK